MANENYIPVDLGEDSVPDNTVGGLPDIPDNEYLFEVDNLEYKINDNDRPQYTLTAFVVSDTPERGTTLSSTFVFKADADDTISNKGRNRFHAWLLAVGYDLSKKRKFKLNPDKVRKSRFVSRTHHETIPASEDGRFAARPVSRFGPFAPDPDNEEAVAIFEAGMGGAATSAKRPVDDEDEAPKKPTRRRPVEDDEPEDEKPTRRKRPADDDEEDEKPTRRRPVAEPEPEEEEEPEDEEPEDKPRSRKPAKDEKPAAKPARRARDDDDEEDERPARRTRRAAEDDPDDEDEFPHRPAGRARRARDDDED